MTKRHQLPSDADHRIIILDGNPNAGDDDVVTHRYDYKAHTDPNAQIEQAHAEAIRWYEMNGAGHGMSALDRGGNATMSKDYDVSVHTQQFFESEAGMLKRK